MDKNNIFLGIEIPCNIGELTQKKVNVLQENFSHEFQNAFLGNDGLVIEKEDRSRSISLANNIIKINMANYISDQKNDIIVYLNKLSSIFMLDDIFRTVIIRIVSQVDVGFNTMNKMKKIGEPMISEKMENLSGVGFRYFFEINSNVYDEFRFEPLLLNHNHFFSEAIFNSLNVNIEQLNELIDKKIEAFNEMMIGCIEKIKN